MVSVPSIDRAMLQMMVARRGLSEEAVPGTLFSLSGMLVTSVASPIARQPDLRIDRIAPGRFLLSAHHISDIN